MRYAVLLARLLGELAAPSHAIHYLRSFETNQISRDVEAAGTDESAFDTFGRGGMLGSGIVDLDELADKGDAGLASDMATDEASKGRWALSLAAKTDLDYDLDFVGKQRDTSVGKEEIFLTPKQRKEAHAKKYSADFIAELNMTLAHDTGKDLGLVLDVRADFEPAMVLRIRKTGLVEEWNRANPSKQVLLGDEITRVNDIQWHANSNMFVKRIVGQYKAARSQKERTNSTLRLYVQRPRDSEYTRFLAKRGRSQLNDVHKRDYAKEFSVELPMPDDIRNTTLDSIMGWTLNNTEEWKPATIDYIAREGSVAAWNKEHPDDLVLEGDELLKIDTIIIFHHNASTFVSRLNQHFQNAQKAEATNRTLLVHIQRPRPVQEAFDAKHPVEEIVEPQSEHRKEFDVQLQFDAVGGYNHYNPLGWSLNKHGPIQVQYIAEDGLVGHWNKQHPDQSIAVNDEIVAVDGDSFENYDSPQEFTAKIQSTLDDATRMGPQGLAVSLTLSRPTQRVRYSRHNMEEGVHMDHMDRPRLDGAGDDDVIGASEE